MSTHETQVHTRTGIPGENIENLAPLLCSAPGYKRRHEGAVMFVTVHGCYHHHFVIVERHLVCAVTKNTWRQFIHNFAGQGQTTWRPISAGGRPNLVPGSVCVAYVRPGHFFFNAFKNSIVLLASIEEGNIRAHLFKQSLVLYSRSTILPARLFTMFRTAAICRNVGGLVAQRSSTS